MWFRNLRALGALLVAGSLLGASVASAADKKGESEAVRALKGALSEIVNKTALKTARAGVMVSSLDSGQVLFTHNPDDLLNPASNVKLFTSGAALARLGPEYRFDTEFYIAPGGISGGVIKNLYVRGKGDPAVVTEKLWLIAGELMHQGIHVVKGDIIIDDSYFDNDREGPGFDQEKGDRAYLAPTGAVSLNFNTVAVHVAPGSRPGERGRIELEPVSEFFQIDNRATTVARSALRRVIPTSIPSSDGRQKIMVVARLPIGSRDQVFYKKIDNPPLYFGYTLKKLLELRGVKVQGKVKHAAVPSDAKLLWVHESESLADVLRRLEKHSNNFIAEQILKTIGAEVKGPPGSWPKGIEAIEDFLAEIGLPRGSYVMKNGSGLNDTNRFSARQHVTLLREMWKRFPIMAEFIGALPIAGRDGTIRWRMEGSDAVGRLRAKTGTLENVTSLSGYVQSLGGEKLVFSVIVNDYPGRYAQVVRAVDGLGGALAAAYGPPAELGAAVAMANPPPAAPTGALTALADLKGHVATYYKLGLAGDKRNVPFLRTALRTERDPVLRMAAAESVYLSDRDSETAAHTFLESLTLDPASFGRLRSLTTELNLQTPLLGSVAELAADGQSEAMGRLVEMAPIMAQSDLADLYGDTVSEVARTAPEELLVALKMASPAVADAALTGVARGLVRDQSKDHPFAGVVKAALVHPDAEIAAFAKLFGPRLEERKQAVEASMKAAPSAATPGSTVPQSGNGG